MKEFRKNTKTPPKAGPPLAEKTKIKIKNRGKTSIMSRFLFAEKKENKNTICGKITSFKEKNMKISATKKANARINSVSLIFLFGFFVLTTGAFYLYQINAIATKGIEMRNIENEIKDLEENQKKMRIKEMELKSMYNIEKETKDLGLVSVSNVSYAEIDGPVAMR